MKNHAITSPAILTTILLIAPFLLFGLAGCDTPAGTAGRPDSPGYETEKQASDNDVEIVLKDLGFQGAPASINDKGQIVGGSSKGHAFLWEEGTLTDLGTLCGDKGRSVATSINEKGQIVGWSETSSGERHAFLWENGKMIDLGTLGGDDSRAESINNKGQVVGQSETSAGLTRAFLWEKGEMIDLGSLFPLEEGESDAKSINDKGQIVGDSYSSSFPFWNAFLWEDGVMKELELVAGTFVGDITRANAINNNGQVVGISMFITEGGLGPVLWEIGNNRGAIHLPKISQDETYAESINDKGQIVGNGFFNAPPDSRISAALLWIDEEMIKLEAPGQYSKATSINNKGQIVGFSDGQAVLWEIKEKAL